MYNLFDNLEAFNTWHDTVKAELGFPIQMYNYGTGEPLEGQFVTIYTVPVVHPLTDTVICGYNPGDAVAAAHEPKLTRDEAVALGYFPPPQGPE